MGDIENNIEETRLLLNKLTCSDVTGMILDLVFKRCSCCNELFNQKLMIQIINTRKYICCQCGDIMAKCCDCKTFYILDGNHFCMRCKGKCTFFCTTCLNTI